MRILRIPDVNQDAASSTASTEAGVTAADVKAKPEASSAEGTQSKTDVKEPTTLAEAAQKVFEKHLKADSSTEEAKTEKKADSDSSVQELNETEEKAEKPEGEEKEAESSDEEKTETEGEKKNEEAVPYDRFKEVNTKLTALQAEYENVKPLVQGQKQLLDYCRVNDISQEDFSQAMEIAALLKRDPLAAWEKLKPVVDGISVLRGESLDKELQDQVDSGDLSLARAKEIAQLRAQVKYGETKSKLTYEQQATQSRQKFIADTQTALTTWQTAKQTADPNYHPKKSATEPDGLYELVNDKWLSLMSQADPKKPEDLVAVAEKAYLAVKQSFQAWLPKPPVKKHLSSNGSSTTKTKEPKTLLEMAHLRAAQHASDR